MYISFKILPNQVQEQFLKRNHGKIPVCSVASVTLLA